jgi:hypothetical protein
MDDLWIATVGLSRCSLSGNGAAFKISISYFRSSASRRLPQRQVAEKPELFRNRSGHVRNRRCFVSRLRRHADGKTPVTSLKAHLL